MAGGREQVRVVLLATQAADIADQQSRLLGAEDLRRRLNVGAGRDRPPGSGQDGGEGLATLGVAQRDQNAVHIGILSRGARRPKPGRRRIVCLLPSIWARSTKRSAI